MGEIAEEFRTKKIAIKGSLSADIKDLLKHVLQVDPDKRYNIDKVLAHPVIVKNRERLKEPISGDEYSTLMRYYVLNSGASLTRDIPEEVMKLINSQKANAAKPGNSVTTNSNQDSMSNNSSDFKSQGSESSNKPKQLPSANFFDAIPQSGAFRKEGKSDNNIQQEVNAVPQKSSSSNFDSFFQDTATNYSSKNIPSTNFDSQKNLFKTDSLVSFGKDAPAAKNNFFNDTPNIPKIEDIVAMTTKTNASKTLDNNSKIANPLHQYFVNSDPTKTNVSNYQTFDKNYSTRNISNPSQNIISEPRLHAASVPLNFALADKTPVVTSQITSKQNPLETHIVSAGSRNKSNATQSTNATLFVNHDNSNNVQLRHQRSDNVADFRPSEASGQNYFPYDIQNLTRSTVFDNLENFAQLQEEANSQLVNQYKSVSTRVISVNADDRERLPRSNNSPLNRLRTATYKYIVHNGVITKQEITSEEQDLQEKQQNRTLKSFSTDINRRKSENPQALKNHFGNLTPNPAYKPLPPSNITSSFHNGALESSTFAKFDNQALFNNTAETNRVRFLQNLDQPPELQRHKTFGDIPSDNNYAKRTSHYARTPEVAKSGIQFRDVVDAAVQQKIQGEVRVIKREKSQDPALIPTRTRQADNNAPIIGYIRKVS